MADASNQLALLEDVDDGSESGETRHLEKSESFVCRVQSPPQPFEGLQVLIGSSGEHGGSGQLDLVAFEEECREPPAFANRNHCFAGLDRDPLGGPMAGAGFVGRNIGVGEKVNVGGEDAIPFVVDHDAPIHLGKLGQAGRTEANSLQAKASGTDPVDTRSRTEHHQSSASLLDDAF